MCNKIFQVMPFSTACNTPLSNFESGQNYKDVVDPAGNECSNCLKSRQLNCIHKIILCFSRSIFQLFSFSN